MTYTSPSLDNTYFSFVHRRDMDGNGIAQVLRDAKSHADSGDMLISSKLYTNATELDSESDALVRPRCGPNHKRHAR